MERNQELSAIISRLLVLLPNASDMQAWLLHDVWPAYGEARATRKAQKSMEAAFNRETKNAERRAKWDAKNRERAERVARAAAIDPHCQYCGNMWWQCTCEKISA
jgi:hypothetical protein